MRTSSLVTLITIFLVQFMFLSYASYSATYYCCFDPDSNSITTKPVCDSTEITLDRHPGETCEDSYPQAYCEINGVCYETLKNGTSEVFLRKNVGKSTTLCSNVGGSIVTSSACSSYSAALPISTTSSTSTNEVSGTSVSSSGTSMGGTPPPTSFVDVHPNEVSQYNEFCSSAGGPFGLFYDKNTCDSNVNCIFNPYRLGLLGFDDTHNYFGADFESFESSGKEEDLYSCRPVVSINSCFDYKTEDSCNSNPAKGQLYSPPNLRDCKWVSRSQYFNLFGLKGGVCISDFTHSNKFFNYDKMSKKGNLIKNPSFEYFSNGVPLDWDVNNGEVVSDEFAFDRTHSLKLSPGGSVSQRIDYLNGRITTYFLSFYVKNDPKFTSNDFIDISLVMYDSNGNKINSIIDSRDLSDFNRKEIYTSFSKVRSYILEEGTESVKLTITNNAGRPIYIDAVSFSYSNENNPAAGPEPFAEYPEIPPEASNCDKCFVERGFNDCTKVKSDLLGDCYYTVTDIDKNYEEILSSELNNDLSWYSGWDFNPLLSMPWTAQSVPNSIMFCEMYNRKSECLNPNNYVNKVYSKFFPWVSDGRICNWDNKVGCYLDSNKKEVPSYFLGRGFEKAVEEGTWSYAGADFRERTLFYFSNPNSLINGIPLYFNYGSSGYASVSGIIPDFSYGCDMVPPSGNFYFVFKNKTGGLEYISKGPSFGSLVDLSGKVLGDGIIHLEFYDRDDPQCEYLKSMGLDVPQKKIFVLYKVNGASPFSGFWKYDKIVNEDVPISSFFVDENGKRILNEGINKIELLVFDQSGNLNWNGTYKFDLDLSPPEVDINLNRSGILTKVNRDDIRVYANDFISLNIKDHSTLKSCRYWLDPIGAVDSSYYDSSVFNINVSGNSTSVSFPVMNNLIYNSSVSGDSYVLWVSCEDIFGHVNETFVTLTADLKTDFVLVSPNDFVMYNMNSGFLNSNSSYFLGASMDTGLDTCKVTVGSSTSQGEIYDDLGSLLSVHPNLDSAQIPTFDKYVYFDIGSLSFAQGRNDVYFECTDSYGGTVKEKHVFYYDTTAPKILNLKMNVKNISYNNSIYVISERPSMSAVVNGTFSWIKDIKGSMVDDMGNQIGINLQKSLFISNNTFLGNFSFVPDVTPLTYGLYIDNGLYKRTYNFVFIDKSGNLANTSFTYYYDSSKPFFNFSGDVALTHGKLYTSRKDPLIKVRFGTPPYREFECNLSLYYGYLSYGPFSLSKGNLIEFRLSDYVNSFDASKGSVELYLSCVDKFGVALSGAYDLVYDSTKPDISLTTKPQTKYYKVGSGVSYEEFSTDLYLSLNNHEDYLSCEYWFEPGTGVICNGDHYKWSSLSPSTSQLIGSNLSVTFGANSICSVTPGIGTREIKVKAICQDAAGLESNASTVVNVGFSDRFLVDLSFNYTNSEVISILKTVLDPSFGPYLYLTKDGDVLAQFTYLDDYDGYRYDLSLPLNDLAEGDYNVVAGLYTSSDTSLSPLETISGSFKVDKTAPEINATILGATNEGGNLVVYGNSFNLELLVKDRIGDISSNPIGLENVKVLLDDGSSKILLWNISKDGNWYNSSYVTEPLIFGNYNYFREGALSFNGFIKINNLSFNSNYRLIIEAEDMMSNDVISTIGFTVKDGVVLFVEDSDNAFADTMNNWFTAVDQPVLKFRTSAPATCEVKPFYDLYYGSLDDSYVAGSDTTEFSIDTASLVSSSGKKFNASLKNNWLIKISCKYNGEGGEKVQDFYVYLNYIAYLPDYVMIPQDSRVISSTNELFKNVVFENKHNYPPIHCKYGFDKNSINKDVGEASDYYNEMSKEIDFSGLLDGIVNVYYVCEDRTGRSGFVKNLTFVKNIGDSFEVYDLRFFKDGRLIVPFKGSDGNEHIYIKSSDSGTGFEMRFRTTKTTNAVSCDYDVIGNSIFDKALSFIGSLSFNYGYQKIKPVAGDYFEFGETGIVIKGGDIIKISCYDNNLNEVIKSIYVDEIPSNSISYNITLS